MADQIHVFRLEGEVPFARAVDDVDNCLRQAVEQGSRRVLIDVRGLTGFAMPGVVERLGMIRRWAASAQGRLKVALLCRSDFIDPERFGVVLAKGMGFDGNVFEFEDEARDWLEQTP